MDKKVEQETIRLIKNGRTDLFKLIVDKYSHPLFVFVSSMMNNSFHTEDIVQETFLSAYNKIDTYSFQKAAFSTWLFRIARNKCVNELKRRQPVFSNQVAKLPSLLDTGQPAQENDFFKLVDQALTQLSDNDRAIFILAEIQELSYEEIHEITQIKMGTIKSKLSRTKQKLKDLLEHYIGDTHEIR